MVNKFIKMLAAYQMNNQVPPGHPKGWPPFEREHDPMPGDVFYPSGNVYAPDNSEEGALDSLDEIWGTEGFPEDRMNKSGALGGFRSTPNGIKAPMPYVGPPRMDMSVYGLREFMNNKNNPTKGQMPGMGFNNLYATPTPMVNTNTSRGGITPNTLASSLLASRSAM